MTGEPRIGGNSGRECIGGNATFPLDAVPTGLSGDDLDATAGDASVATSTGPVFAFADDPEIVAFDGCRPGDGHARRDR